MFSRVHQIARTSLAGSLSARLERVVLRNLFQQFIGMKYSSRHETCSFPAGRGQNGGLDSRDVKKEKTT